MLQTNTLLHCQLCCTSHSAISWAVVVIPRHEPLCWYSYHGLIFCLFNFFFQLSWKSISLQGRIIKPLTAWDRHIALPNCFYCCEYNVHDIFFLQVYLYCKIKNTTIFLFYFILDQTTHMDHLHPHLHLLRQSRSLLLHQNHLLVLDPFHRPSAELQLQVNQWLVCLEECVQLLV